MKINELITMLEAARDKMGDIWVELPEGALLSPDDIYIVRDSQGKFASVQFVDHQDDADLLVSDFVEEGFAATLEGRIMRAPLYMVEADRETGTWIDKRMVGEVDLDDWHALSERIHGLDDLHFDTFELDEITCAVILEWID